ncbi:MAG: chemotaxis protein CheX [Phycisphaeraceae bacterium]|nr:chemotaxis protein CheX [Phycisphaeraceae bacterium]MBX3366450.1 chemotaxis protein CheX [Phycisphaeraceae bacterium]QYK47146.1 MAG: chemotaxis protein CheX [Phycisphaeraceae bacterium]
MLDELSLPFVSSAENVFSTMLNLQVQVGQPAEVPVVRESAHDVSGIIAMSGDIEGTVALRFPADTAVRVASLFAGIEIDTSTPDFADAVGELANMVVGGAKAKFKGKNISISCPSIIVGQNHLVVGSRDAVCVSIPCECECGSFAVDVLLNERSAQQFGLRPRIAA